MHVFSSMLPFHCSLSLSHFPPFSVRLQDCGVISSGAYQPSLGNCLQVLSLQQGSLRPLRVLPSPPPVQEDMHWHNQQAAEARLLERIRARAREPRQQHTNDRVTQSELMHWGLSWKYVADLSLIMNKTYIGCSCPCLLGFGLTCIKKDNRQGRIPAQEYHCACILSAHNSKSVQWTCFEDKQSRFHIHLQN